MRTSGLLLTYPLGEKRMLYIVHACAAKDVYFKGIKPLKACPKR